MKLWRLVLEADREAWTFVVAATDPFVALELARDALPSGKTKGSTLEELEAIYDRPPGRAGVVQAWRDGEQVSVDAPQPTRRKPTSARTRRSASAAKAKKVKTKTRQRG